MTPRERAEAMVLKLRGSYDAPGFEACVQAEIEAMETIGITESCEASAP